MPALPDPAAPVADHRRALPEPHPGRDASAAVREELDLPPEPDALEPPPTLREVFDAHARFVWRSLRYLGASERDVADLSQEVFLVVHRKLPELRGRASLRSWLYRICAHVASDHRRRAHVRREVLSDSPPATATAPRQHVDLVNQENEALLQALLATLDEDKRIAFVLYEIEELELREVAYAVGAPLKTVFARVQAARKRILEGARRAEARGGRV